MFTANILCLIKYYHHIKYQSNMKADDYTHAYTKVSKPNFKLRKSK